MSNFGDKVQPAVKKETKNVAIYTVVGVVVMWVGFLILHLIWPEKIPFDYRVILGGIGGGAVAVLNFFLMGMAVQKAVSETDEAGAKRRMQASYSQRNLMQKKQHKALNLISGESRKDGTAFLNRNSEAAIRL